MSSIRLSPKYGLNPTIPVCFWCGEDKKEIALMGRIGRESCDDIEAPRHACIDFEPCDKCEANMALGFTLMEATSSPNGNCSVAFSEGIYPTGNYVVVKPEAVRQWFGDISAAKGGKAFVNHEVFRKIMEAGNE